MGSVCLRSTASLNFLAIDRKQKLVERFAILTTLVTLDYFVKNKFYI